MSFSILIIGFLLFFASLAIHVAIWRWRRPKNDALGLFFVFLVFPILVISVAIVHRTDGILCCSALNSIFMPLNLASSVFLHVALSAVYIMSYPASQAVCPSLTILLIVANTMPRGCTQEEIQCNFNNNILLDTRFQDLIDAKLAKEIDGTLILTQRGVAMIRLFVLFRRLLGLPIGDG